MGVVIIADVAGPFAAKVTAALGPETELTPVAVSSAVDALAHAGVPDAEVVLFGPSIGSDETFGAAADLLGRPDPPAVLVVATELSTELLRRALRVGVSDVLADAEQPDELVAAVVRASQATRARRAAGEPVALPTPEAQRARIVTVFGTKGGVGKSVLATNLAVALGGQLQRVILVDLDLQSGDAAIMLQLTPDRTVYDVTQAFDRLDEEMLDAFLVRHESGVRALLAPVRPEQAEAVTSGKLNRILDLLGGMADVIVIDTPATLSDVVLTAVERSDEVYTVATMDVPAIKNVRVSLDRLAQLGLADGRCRLVLNRADSKVGLTRADVEEATGCAIAATIPSDRLVPRSVNKGVPVVRDAPRSAVARSLVELSRSITAEKGVTTHVA